MLTPQQIQGYLERIGFAGRACPDATTLGALQYAHLHSVPYDTLDIVNGVPLDLSTEGLYRKIVKNRRGGYCFELNGLYAQLLEALGFSVTLRFARYLRGEQGIPMPRHEILTVRLPEGEWLTDVGVGAKIPLYPVRLSSEPQPQQNGVWGVVPHPVFGRVLAENVNGQWEPVYTVPEAVSYPVDFVATGYYCEHSPDSVFRRSVMLSLRTPEGRVTADGSEFRRFTPAGVTTETAQSPEDFRRLVKQYFGMEYESGNP